MMGCESWEMGRRYRPATYVRLLLSTDGGYASHSMNDGTVGGTTGEEDHCRRRPGTHHSLLNTRYLPGAAT